MSTWWIRSSAARPALAAARAALADRGIRLLLDYVPNHVAPDHPWVTSGPSCSSTGPSTTSRPSRPRWLAAGGRILAHGRDPYFPPWPDVVQLNAFSPALRAEAARTLASIASQCDGIRCDMAMLMTNEVFGRTWGARAGPEPTEEFWPAVIGELRTGHPETVLIAEAYWDMEWTLQQQGFDFCYDKRLYDRIIGGDWTASAVTCTPTWAISRGWCASWRTTTSPGSRTACPVRPARPRR